MKKILILGGGGFIGGHLAQKLKKENNWVRVIDIKKKPDFFDIDDICHEYISYDLRNPSNIEHIFLAPNQRETSDHENSFDEVYQLAADMGGAGYLFTELNDSNVMHNSLMINLNVCKSASICSVKKIFYASSACVYPEHNQEDSENPNCEENSVYPANPDSEYGWEKLFSERLFMAYAKNNNLNIKIARFHNIFGPRGTWNGGKEKAPAAICRKVSESKDGGFIEIWGSGKQTRSFLYIEECLKAIEKFMNEPNFNGPVNIGSDEMISINSLAEKIISLSNKNISVKNLQGEEFKKKYGFHCPVGVNGRNSDNTLFKAKMGWSPELPLEVGLKKTYEWIYDQNKKI